MYHNLLTSIQIERLFKIFAEARPRPKIELNYINVYTLLVAVVLSAQSTDKGVNRVTTKLFALADSPQKMVTLGESKLKEEIRSLGLYNTKASNIIAMSKLIIARFHGEVPCTQVELEQLPGVGRKSAKVVLNSYFNIATIAVDTHVFRVSNRIGLCQARTILAVEDALERVIPEPWKLYAHHWLVLHGRYVCKAKKPNCNDCVVQDICKYALKGKLD